MSKKLVLNAAGDAATVSDASVGDIVTTIFATDTAITGAYGLVQRGLLFLGGMAAQSYRREGTVNPFAS